MTMKSTKYHSASVYKTLVILFFSFIICAPAQLYAASEKKLSPQRDQQKICIQIIDSLEDNHYLEKELGNSMSAIILNHYIKRLDPGKRLFLLSDISDMNKYKYILDDELKRGNLKPAFQIFNLFLSRSKERFEVILSLIPEWEKNFDFTKEEFLTVENDDRRWEPSLPELHDSWKKDLKNHIILMLLEKENKEKITERLTKIYSNRLTRLLQTDSNDVFQLFMNSVTTSYDPHTQYMPPKMSEEFDIGMSHSLEGIGALLQTEYEYTKVVRLIPKGPADKSKLLMPGDKIIGVGEGLDGEIIDTLGQRIDYVVRLIRGPKNTFVRLKIIPSNESTSTKTIQIKRDTVKLEDKAAKKNVITFKQDQNSYKIGVIEIPQFYVDFDAYRKGDKNYKSLTRDVRILLNELEEENIDGLIIDLRDNGGGSLDEARKITGLFIKSGPVVQIKGKTFTERLYDNDRNIIYSGPLVVMINRMSASASEIFAGAIKDYNRGIIVGSRTFGKGTVQQLSPIGLGNLKLTSSKFYRISGESTQNLGVLPDLNFPQLYKVEDTGESSLENALPWDTTSKTFFWAYPSLDNVIKTLIGKYNSRSVNSPGLVYLKKKTDMSSLLSAQNQLSLNLEKRELRKTSYEKMALEIENEYLVSKGEKPLSKIDEEQSNTADPKEILMEQAHHVMADFIRISKAFDLSW